MDPCAPQERQGVRQERSRPLIVELQAWSREQRAKLSRNNNTKKLDIRPMRVSAIFSAR